MLAFFRASNYHRTVDTLLTVCVSPGDKRKPSLNAGRYSLEATIRNLHVSTTDDRQIWSKLKTDAQLQVGVSAIDRTATADQINWVLMSGIDVFLGGNREGLDSRLKKFTENNKPTSELRASSKIDIPTGVGSLQVQVFGQRKDSFWRQLLTIVSGVLSSPVFGVLPIPKMVPEVVKFATTVFDRIQSQERLVEILTSAKIDFKLYDGASTTSPFVLKPGHWLTIDRSKVASKLDSNGNLPGYVLDIPGMFWELKEKDDSNKPVDANYSVVTLEFPELKA